MNALSLVLAAQDYANRGWSVIPLRGKLPALRTWKVYQTVRTTEDAALEKWFSREDVTGIGVILGAVSGGLVVRDFDDPESYRRWALEHADLARILPTVRSSRGFHVYARCCCAHPPVTLADGEFRSSGQYIAAPPSIHPSGARYEWVVPLPVGEIAEIDPSACGLLRSYCAETLCATESVESSERTEWTEAPESTETPRDCIEPSESRSALSLDGATEATDSLIEKAIRDTVPRELGQRHRRLFLFARRLKTIPAVASLPIKELKPIVRRWHIAALPHMLSRDFDECWGEFVMSWRRIKWAEGEGPLGDALKRAEENPQPARAAEYERPALRLLVALCRELQRFAGEAPFFISGLKAGALLGVDPGTASRWLVALTADGVLKVAERPQRGAIRAIRYQYLPNLDE